MRVESEQIVAPPFPDQAVWINTVPLRLDECVGRGPLLVEFWDFARVNSLRTMPYIEEWHRRYSPLGATVIGAHTPGYSASAGEDDVRAAVERLGIARPVILDHKYELWYDYGNKGWPGRYLWGPKGQMRYWHYGEGDYLDCELALQDALREFGFTGELPAPMDPLRLEDVPGATMTPQTADIALPADVDRVELQGRWSEGVDFLKAEDAAASLTTPCDAGGAWAVLSGSGVAEPGCHELAIADDHVSVVAQTPGLRVHSLQFTPRA